MLTDFSYWESILYEAGLHARVSGVFSQGTGNMETGEFHPLCLLLLSLLPMQHLRKDVGVRLGSQSCILTEIMYKAEISSRLCFI